MKAENGLIICKCSLNDKFLYYVHFRTESVRCIFEALIAKYFYELFAQLISDASLDLKSVPSILNSLKSTD